MSGWAGCLLLLLTPFSQAQEAYGKSEDPVVAEALGVQIRTRNPEEMAYAIKQVLYLNYIKEHGLEATKEEIEQFITRKQQLVVLHRKEDEARRVEVQKALQSKNLPDAERKQLEDDLKLIDEMFKMNQDADKHAGDPERVAAEEQLARSFIMQWKVNQSLYQQYGGRVVYQQVGAEPLDAYYNFLKEAQKAGDFRILNKDFEPALWTYYTTDSKHSFYPEKGDEKEQAINTPWWMMEPQTGQ